ncbi:MAG: type IV secretory system conjugative DNA transfer family protein [Bacilli bacterium]|nr:type IV secretory system conjugative DNA transfer family protein [Bacilli bacterium]
MKFKVSKDDLLIFIIFCILLLYLCAIGVMNFVTFGAEGHLWGLNPFPAFGPKYIAITLVLFFAALIMIFTSVSSYIFSREKGSGIGIKIGEKEEKGYNRWAKDKEIKEDTFVEKVSADSLSLDSAGVVLAHDKNEMWVDNGEYHTLVIGSSGSGKTRCVVKPLVNVLAKHGESMIVTDPKGELYQDCAEHLKELGYNVIILNFREPAKGSAWNPLTLPYQYYKEGNKDKATELLDDVALNILYDPNNKGEPFWEKSAADYFSGLAISLFENAKEEETNLNSINVMSTEGDERFGTSHYINEYFNLMGKQSTAYTFASNTINAPSETQGGILSTFRQKIRLFASRENLSEMLGHSDFDLRDIGKGKTAVFIVIHDEKTTYHSLATIFIKQCYETLIDVAQENGGKLPFRTNFILDEFANMPPLKDVDAMVTAARSRLIRFTFIIQNFAQLNDVYGKEVAEVIRGNCGNTIYLISTELAALEEISKMCGEVKSKKDDKTDSRPLVTVTDLQQLKFPDAILMRLRKHPFKTKLPLNDQINWGYEIKKAEYPSRELKPIQIFDIKTFVKEKKKEKTLNDINSNTSNPMGIGGINPFKMPSNIGSMRGPAGDMNFDANPFMNFNPNPRPMSPLPNLSDIDIDQMMRDIDKKIAELDAEEERKKKELQNSTQNIKEEVTKEESNATPIIDNTIKDEKESNISQKIENKEENDFIDIDFELPSIETIKKEKQNIKQEEIKEDKIEILQDVPKPKINVDADSIVVDENIISDDEFFDDFFGDD